MKLKDFILLKTLYPFIGDLDFTTTQMEGAPDSNFLFPFFTLLNYPEYNLSFS
jgi:hypothetical protein